MAASSDRATLNLGPLLGTPVLRDLWLLPLGVPRQGLLCSAFNNYLLNTYYVPGTGEGTGQTGTEREGSLISWDRWGCRDLRVKSTNWASERLKKGVERTGHEKSYGKRVPDRGNKGPEVRTSLFYRKDQSWPAECEEAIGLGTGRGRSSRACGLQVGFGVLFSGQWEAIGQLHEGE